MSKTILYVIAAALFWLIVCAIWPYWNRYMMELDLKAAALYGTKHSIEDTGKFLREKYKERGYDFDQEDFHIEKDENKTVSIKITYQDEITFFGFILKELEFKLEVTERETEQVF